MSELKRVKLARPEYDEVLPSTGETVKITPYNVGDEKILLMAAESGNQKQMASALTKMIKNNVIGKEVDEMAPVDIEYLFLKLRGVSVGDKPAFRLKCQECDTYNDVNIDLDELEVKKDETHTNIIRITDDLGFEMKYLQIEDAIGVTQENVDDILNLVSKSVKTVFYGDDTITVGKAELADLKSILEELTTTQFQKLSGFFETLPKIEQDVEFDCKKCESQNAFTLRGLADFFQ